MFMMWFSLSWVQRGEKYVRFSVRNKSTRMWECDGMCFAFVSALGKKLLSSMPVRCLFLCLLAHHTCPPPTLALTLVPFHRVYICLLQLVYFSSVYDTARVSGGPPRRTTSKRSNSQNVRLLWRWFHSFVVIQGLSWDYIKFQKMML